MSERIAPENVPWPLVRGRTRRAPSGAILLAGIVLAGLLALAGRLL